MADLRIDYKDDLLDTSVNEKRKYNMIQNADGTVSFEDVTVYSQVGDSFGSSDVNEITGAINGLNNNLIASDNTPFRFGVNSDGQYGYIVTDSEGADTVIPFKGGFTIKAYDSQYASWSGNQSVTASASYTATKKCNYMLLVYNECLVGYYTDSTSIKITSAPNSTWNGAYYGGEMCRPIIGTLNAGEVVSATASMTTTKHFGFSNVYIFTDE